MEPTCTKCGYKENEENDNEEETALLFCEHCAEDVCYSCIISCIQCGLYVCSDKCLDAHMELFDEQG